MKIIGALLVGALAYLLVIIWRVYNGDKVTSVKPDGTVNFEKDTMPKGAVDLNGNWTMYFDFSRCNSVAYRGKDIQTKYSIAIVHQGWIIKGSGSKVSEIRNGKETHYQQANPVTFHGRIQNGIVVLNFYENNDEEVAGIITLPYGTKNFKLSGDYKATGKNCDGPVKLERFAASTPASASQ